MKQRQAILLLLILICSIAAQAQPSEEEFVRSAINKLFEGMRSGDSAMVKAAFAPDAILQTVSGKKNDTTVLVTGSLQRFLNAVGTPHTEVWDEQTPYRFYLGGKFSHCGVNAFQLVKFTEGWKIVYLADTRRKEGCL